MRIIEKAQIVANDYENDDFARDVANAFLAQNKQIKNAKIAKQTGQNVGREMEKLFSLVE